MPATRCAAWALVSEEVLKDLVAAAPISVQGHWTCPQPCVAPSRLWLILAMLSTSGVGTCSWFLKFAISFLSLTHEKIQPHSHLDRRENSELFLGDVSKHCHLSQATKETSIQIICPYPRCQNCSSGPRAGASSFMAASWAFLSRPCLEACKHC